MNPIILAFTEKILRENASNFHYIPQDSFTVTIIGENYTRPEYQNSNSTLGSSDYSFHVFPSEENVLIRVETEENSIEILDGVDGTGLYATYTEVTALVGNAQDSY